MADALRRSDHPDPDLFEYVLLSAPDVEGLAPVASAVLALVRAGSIHIVDAVLLSRPDAQATVRTASPEAHHELAELGRAVHGGPRLSAHDIELVSLTLAPHESALLLLVEDRWAGALAAAAREGGARVAASERIPRERLLESMDADGSAARHGRIDLLLRGPGSTPLVDQVEQVRELARLVERGLLPIDRYEAQRRRVLQG
jgi:hypothetical protein